MPMPRRRANVPARLAEALELANAAIAHETAENPALSGMGCTLIGAAFGARRASNG